MLSVLILPKLKIGLQDYGVDLVILVVAQENMLFMMGKFGRLIIHQPRHRLIAVRIEVMVHGPFGGMQRNAKLRRHHPIITE